MDELIRQFITMELQQMTRRRIRGFPGSTTGVDEQARAWSRIGGDDFEDPPRLLHGHRAAGS